jgi:importin subunit beta-1
MEIFEEEFSAEVTLHDIIPQAVGTLMPVILNLLLLQPDDPDEENYSIQNNASVLLVYMAEVLRDDVLDHVIPFISDNIVSAEWRNKEAALTAFGSILEGPSSEKCTPIIQAAVEMLVECFQHPHPIVRATTAFALGRVCEFHSTTIPAEHLPSLITALINSLEDESSKVASQSCYSLYQLAVACEEYREDPTNVLSEYFQTICEHLLEVTTRDDWDVDNLRLSAYETIMAVVDYSAADVSGTVFDLLNDALNRLEATFASREDVEEKMHLQSCLCGLISSCVLKLRKEDLEPCCDRIITLALQVFTTKGALAHEDAFGMVGKFAEKIGSDFDRYMAHFAPCLITGLHNLEEYQVCATAVCAVGDISRALTEGELLPYCDSIIESLLHLLQSNDLHRSVKPPILSSFSDIAMSIGEEFYVYAPVVVEMLEQAGTVSAGDDADEDLIEYVNCLRESILEAYTGILHGLGDGDGKGLDVLIPHLDQLLVFMETCSTYEHNTTEIVKSCIALLGDLGQYFGNKMNGVYEQPYVSQLVQQGMQSEPLREITTWTCGIIESCRNS